jgi:hypothetical protein
VISANKKIFKQFDFLKASTEYLCIYVWKGTGKISELSSAKGSIYY